MTLSIHGPYGDPRQAAERENRTASVQERQGLVHGLTPQTIAQLNERMENMLPQLVSSNPSSQRQAMFQDRLPRGASFSPQRTAQMLTTNPSSMMGAGGRNLVTVQRPYQPEYESPDRQQYPVHRVLANRYWRLFHKLDPVVGNGIDLFAEMPWSDFDLTGAGVDGEIKDQYQRMCDVCQLLAVLPFFVREFLVVGEVAPHCFFDSDEDIWTYIALHNPDQLEVIDAPFIKMDPIVEFVPDEQLRQIVTSSDPLLAPVRRAMPPELIARLMARQNIPLATDLNVTFIPRKLHPYDTRGTSILSRLWRIFMYEDAVFNASIATARRHAGPLKIAKLGNATTGWIPGPEHERRFLELVAQAEFDVHAWIVYHYGLQLEAFGTTDRVMTINREWELCERVKLIGLGLSKAFLHGEVTYASASTGLQVFLRRLLTLRKFFESVWIYPRFFKPIAEINGWYKRDKKEQVGHYRVKRTAQQIHDENRLIIPEIVWNNTLNPQVDAELIRAYESLERLGVRITKGKKLAAVNLDFEEELEGGLEEDLIEKKMREKYGVAEEKKPEEKKQWSRWGDEGEQPEQKTQLDMFPPKPEDRPPPKPVYPTEEEVGPQPSTVDSSILTSSIWLDGKYGNWNYKEVEPLVELLKYGDTDAPFWQQLMPKREVLADGRKVWSGSDPHGLIETGDVEEAWAQIDELLQRQNYPEEDIKQLRDILHFEGILQVGGRPSRALDSFYSTLPEDASDLSDDEFSTSFDAALRSVRRVSTSGSNGTKKKSTSSQSRQDNYLVGGSSWSVVSRRKTLIADLGEHLRGKTAHQCDCGHPHHQEQNPYRKTAVETPEIQDPTNYDSREHWQRALHKSKIPGDAKRYIKQLENEVVDGADESFSKLWEEIESRLDRGLPMDVSTISGVVGDAARRLTRNIDPERFNNAFNGLYSSGKEFSYLPTGFKEKKLDKIRRFKGASLIAKEAVTIDTLEDQRTLQNIRNTALEKVRSIADEELRNAILEKLTSPEAVGKNPLDLANEIMREERRRREEGVAETDVDRRRELQQQMRQMYDDQLWKLQRIMRTESVNGFVLAQLTGYKEQGIVKVKWNSHRDDPITCPLCRTMDGQEFEIDAMITSGGNYPLTQYSHPNCRCWLSPVIVHVTFEQFEQRLREDPNAFQTTRPEYDNELLGLEDLIKDVQTTSFQSKNTPVEHERSLRDVGEAIAQSPYSSHQPDEIEFVPDVYRTDEFRREVNPEEDMAGQVVSWTSSSGKTYVSNFASENTPIEDVVIRNWAQEIWRKEAGLREEVERLYRRTPERTTIPNIDPGSAQVLKATLTPQPVGRPYYLGNREVMALEKRFRDLPADRIRRMLTDAGMAEADAETVSTFAKSDPMWDLETGEAVDNIDPSVQNRFLNQTAALAPDTFFQEGLVAFMMEPWTLHVRDPELYDYYKQHIFGGREFK